MCAYHPVTLGSNSKHIIYTFWNLYFWNCNKKRKKINKKRPGLAHILKKYALATQSDDPKSNPAEKSLFSEKSYTSDFLTGWKRSSSRSLASRDSSPTRSPFRFCAGKQYKPANRHRSYAFWCLGLVVMGDDSCLKGRGFKSQHCKLDRHYLTIDLL